MTTSIGEPEAIYSTFGADPVLGELVELYAGEMPQRIAALEQAFSEGDRELLCRAAHQMKGAAGSYGFDSITAAAAALEGAVRDGQPPASVQRTLDRLLALCRRIRAGGPQ